MPKIYDIINANDKSKFLDKKFVIKRTPCN